MASHHRHANSKATCNYVCWFFRTVISNCISILVHNCDHNWTKINSNLYFNLQLPRKHLLSVFIIFFVRLKTNDALNNLHSLGLYFNTQTHSFSVYGPSMLTVSAYRYVSTLPSCKLYISSACFYVGVQLKTDTGPSSN